MPRTSPSESGTRSRILDAAEGLAQARGFNGFSYADVAARLGVTKASLHYHFPGKAQLGQTLIERYAARFLHALDEIDAVVTAPVEKLGAYADLYADVLRQERMCLCGMLAAEYETLPGAMRAAIRNFFDENQRWLMKVMTEGLSDGTMRFPGTPEDRARTILDGLEGALLVARTYGDASRFQSVARNLITSLSGAR
ncbi:MAG TPA: TetR/AcrR family transcriptional regulator [Solirubrobacteraceae bacterium]|jgi:TetR/AcrR family transcriptional repressor of nem operon|nr:TetR/AcrR family transcriptional regulator [Solirubrobacteraceae bacterium]